MLEDKFYHFVIGRRLNLLHNLVLIVVLVLEFIF